MLSIFSAERAFILPYALTLFIAAIFSVIYGKAGLHLSINQFVGSADNFFSVVTFLGDGITALCFIIVLVFHNINMAIRLILAILFSAMIVWMFKYLVFTNAFRPLVFFEQLHIPLK